MSSRSVKKPPDQSETKDQASVAPLLLDAKAVAAMLSISRSMLYQISNTGELGPMSIKLGKRRLWRYDELAAWVRAGCPSRGAWVKMAQDQGFGHQHSQRF
jgi:predicted DNA-binding transcriptional regulator AlpA